ncbi:hypothetical protein ACIBO4_04845 [Streptomyces sp. NPDC050149]
MRETLNLVHALTARGIFLLDYIGGSSRLEHPGLDHSDERRAGE